jgi:preprotein translocase subunit SecY
MPDCFLENKEKRLMKELSSILRRILFLGSFLLAGLAVLEKVFNLFGYTLLRRPNIPWHLLEFAAIGLLFVIVLQLREIRISLTAKTTKD